MNGQINQLVKSLLQKESLEQCSLQELQNFADRHPYFGAAQLLLTKKLKTENSSLYDEQLQKTFLFFHNPLWVEQLLNDTGAAEVIPAKKAAPADPIITTTAPEQVEQIITTGTEPVAVIEEQPSPEYTDVVSMAEEKADEAEIKIPALKMETIDPATAELSFEPYHTVDYFASQGIKFKEEEKPVDKFGVQLKSFTAWLKTMKKLPLGEITAAVDGNSEKKVEQLAEHSLQQREVLTEAMAEVWEKQGNREKAIEIYRKLSLLEPSKSPYFAAKIESLK